MTPQGMRHAMMVLLGLVCSEGNFSLTGAESQLFRLPRSVSMVF